MSTTGVLDSKVLTGTVDGDVFTTLQKVVFLKIKFDAVQWGSSS